MSKSILPTKREIIRELKGEIEMHRRSYTHRSGKHIGKITDRTVLHTIRCLELAVLIVREHKFPRRR